jgi:Pyridoxamine 5'-phosphate oxidase
MVTFRPELTEQDQDWINQQKLFFVGTAPLSSSGRVNLSPKGYDAFRILSPKKIAYLELTGSGIETVTHLHENGRITIMFSAFEGAPKIIRLWCKGTVHPAGSNEFVKLQKELFPDFIDKVGVRSIITGDILEIGQSCGFGVPLYEYKEPRQVLLNYLAKKTPEAIETYWEDKNSKSIDGIPSQLTRSNPSGWLLYKLHSCRDAVGPLALGIIAGSVITVGVMKSYGLAK